MVEFQKLVSKADYVGASGVERRFFRGPKILPQTHGIRVFEGNAGDRAGIQMKGGTLVVKGTCGKETGCGMLRGNILVSGDSGENTGNHMYGGCIFAGGTVESVGHRQGHYVAQGKGVILAGRVNVKDHTPPGMWVITNHMRNNWWDTLGELLGRNEDNLIVIDRSRLDIGRLVDSVSQKILPESSEAEVYALFTGLKKEVYSRLAGLGVDEMGRFIKMQTENKNKGGFRKAMLGGISQIFEFHRKEDSTAPQKAENWVHRHWF